MRSLFLLFVAASAFAAQVLSPADEAEIRAAIEAESKTMNSHDSGEIWSERGPGAYRIESMESLVPGVALVEATWNRAGTFPEVRQMNFILTKATAGHWTIAKRLPACQTRGYLMPVARNAAIRGARLFGLSRLNERASPNWSRT